MLATVIADVSESDVMLFAFGILFVFLLLFTAFLIGWRISNWKSCPSIYSKLPLRRASSLSYYSIEKVLRYLHTLHQYDNRMFDFRKASFCRETGRIFQNTINWMDIIHVDWNYLQSRFPGQFVSWGSLSRDQQAEIREAHESLEGFQTRFSSKRPAPINVEAEFALMKPGPLYVDISTKVLLGWKEVPGTELEVLIVQRPKPPPQTKFTPIEWS